MRDDIDADADRQRVAAAVEQRGFEQDAGELGAVGEHVVRPFQLEAVAPGLPARRRRRRCRCCRSARRRPARRPAPARRRSRAWRQASTRHGRRAAASRQDCRAGVSQARPRRPRPLSCRFETIQSLPGSPCLRALQRERVGRADRLVRFEPVSVERWPSAPVKSPSEERLGGGLGHLADRAADHGST